MIKVFIRTFGCQMNERDSELIAGMLIEKGYEMAASPEEADIILFNTCSVRQHAEDRVKGNLQKLASRKKKDPALKIGVLGCMAQRHGELLFKEFPQVDIVVGASNIYSVPEVLERAMAEEKVLAIDNAKRPVQKEESAHRTGILSAYVNITYGCDNYCSYCIVPHVRGREVSRPRKDIIEEVKLLVDKGFKEVTLLGQNVNSYDSHGSSVMSHGSGGGGQGFVKLLEDVNKIKGIERIRFTTSHPKDASKALFRAIRDLDKVCEHIHLPLQSGSDKILDLMNRKYTIAEYEEKINSLREMVPGMGVTTDIIVGFPSEKERDYEATKKALEKIRFNAAFIFKYSPRPPAVSSCLVDDVPDEVKSERNNELLGVQKEIALSINKALIGTEQEVLVEGKSRMSDDEMTGRTRANISCVFPGGIDLAGTLVTLRIKGASPFTLKGEIVSK